MSAWVYCDVIRRTGTGEVPYTGVVLTLGPEAFPQPLTFSTVTYMFPLLSTTLMKTCRKPMMVTAVVPVPAITLVLLS